MNISKAKLEELFVDELARLQPTAGFVRLVKDRVLHAWREMKTDAAQRIAEIERKQKAIREKLDRLDQAFLFERSIDVDTYDRHRDRLREELTLAQLDRYSCELEKMDVEGILAFAERVLPTASNLWVQSRSLRSSGCSRCSFRTEFVSTGRGLLEPAQPCRFSTT